MKILVFAAHPDDEVLGCGGTIAAHTRRGDEVRVVLFAEGVTSRFPRRSTAARAALTRLRSAARKANRILGVTKLIIQRFPDNRMDSVPLLEVVRAVEVIMTRFPPDVVYTHYGSDLNVDHRVVHQAVNTACRPMPGHPVRTLLYFEVQSSTEWQPAAAAIPFMPDWFSDISATLALKLKALRVYAAEMRPWPHARSLGSVEALARFRGASVGTEAAEAFVLGRHITRIGR